MAKAILAGKEVKKLPPQNSRRHFAPAYTIFPWFPKNFFLGNSPCYTGYWNSKNKQI